MTGTAASPLVVAIRMGYGHLRPATALAEHLGVPVLECDQPPLAPPREQAAWARTRHFYEGLTRLSTGRGGGPLAALVARITEIPPLHPEVDRSAPDPGARALAWMGERGLGAGLAERLRATGTPLLATFFAPALLADRAGCERVYCVVTDSDVHRVWAPLEPARSRITYLAPSARVVRRLAAYGVAPERIVLTGFPLPHALVGGPDRGVARRRLGERLARLDPQGRFRDALGGALAPDLVAVSAPAGPPRLTFAVGGAGAQTELGCELVTALADELRAGHWALSLVAGVRPEVAARFTAHLAGLGLDRGEVEILFEPEHARYFAAFDALLARTDVLWTKPSELAFYAALGLPIVGSPAVGAHEGENLRWLVEHGAAVAQPEPRAAAGVLADWLADGTLAGCAWNGFHRLPGTGLYEILARVTGQPGARTTRHPAEVA